ncbi:hypothetical protein BU15DRAFT_65394 [Melanogaster broomeanus]|nr:hypothetical protein BU15DRAFT_65394 [Melanogaster broomeanus]
MALRFLTHVIQPLLLFPFLSFIAIQFIFGLSLYQNGLQAKLNAICDPTVGLASHPFRLPYTNRPDADKIICGMVSFFNALMDPSSRPLLAEVLTTAAVLSIIPFVEAAREKRSFLLRTPAAVGVLFQFASLGVIMPLYSLLLVITGTASRRPSPSTTDSKINQANAEALLFALLAGYVVPTVCMVVYDVPNATAIWQAFPLLMEFAQFAHRLIRPASRYVDSGHRTVMATFALLFVVSAAVHAAYVWPLLGDLELLTTIFAPSRVALDPAATSLTEGVGAFIRWDVVIGAGATMLATLWMASSVEQVFAIVLWHGLSTVVFGPGAAIAGVLLWREAELNGGTQVEKLQEKTQ